MGRDSQFDPPRSRPEAVTGGFIPGGCQVPYPGMPGPWCPPETPTWPSPYAPVTAPYQLGWECPKCGQVWSLSFLGPCTCSRGSSTTTANQFGFKECDHNFPPANDSTALPACTKCGQMPFPQEGTTIS